MPVSDSVIAWTPQGAVTRSRFMEEAAQIVEDTAAKDAQRKTARMQKDDWYERFAYVQEDESYFDLRDRREISRSTFNALFRHIPCRSIHNGAKIEAATCYDENRESKGAHALVGITYAAGDGIIVHRSGHQYGNRWRDARHGAIEFEAGKPWLLRFFDQIRFYPVSEAELLQIRRDFPAGRHRLRIEHGEFGMHAYRQFLAQHATEIDAFKARQQAACAPSQTLSACGVHALTSVCSGMYRLPSLRF